MPGYSYSYKNQLILLNFQFIFKLQWFSRPAIFLSSLIPLESISLHRNRLFACNRKLASSVFMTWHLGIKNLQNLCEILEFFLTSQKAGQSLLEHIIKFWSLMMRQRWDFIDNYIKYGYLILIFFINKYLDLKSQAKLMLCETTGLLFSI